MIKALQKRPYGVITYDESRCLGCRYCQIACPFNVPKFQWDEAFPASSSASCAATARTGRAARPAPRSAPAQAVIYGTR